MNIAYVLLLLPTPSLSAWVDCYVDSVARTMEIDMNADIHGKCSAVNVCANAVVTETINDSCFDWTFQQNADNTQNLLLYSSNVCVADHIASLSWTCPSPEIINVTGCWATGSFSSVPVQVTYSYGTTHTSEIDNIDTWSQSVTKSMSASFGVTSSVGISDEVDTQTTTAVSQGTSDVLTTAENDSYSYSVTPGQVWQWTWVTVDTDGTSTSLTNDLVVTNGTYDVPCCIPGYFTDPANPTGSCAPDADGAIYQLC